MHFQYLLSTHYAKKGYFTQQNICTRRKKYTFEIFTANFNYKFEALDNLKNSTTQQRQNSRDQSQN